MFKHVKQKAWSYKQDNINYYKQNNILLIEKYKSIKYMKCIKPPKLHEKQF
jgi:hypothetical protein